MIVRIAAPLEAEPSMRHCPFHLRVTLEPAGDARL
jgi:hypothetical protein